MFEMTETKWTWGIALFSLACIIAIGILGYYFGYIRQYLFYYDTLYLQYKDSENTTYYLQNTVDGTLNWTLNKDEASLLRILPGYNSSTIGGYLTTNVSSFSLQDTTYGSSLLVNNDSTVTFSKSNNSEFYIYASSNQGVQTQTSYVLGYGDSCGYQLDSGISCTSANWTSLLWVKNNGAT